MKQFYDFKVEKIKDLSPEDKNLREENLDLFYKNGFPNKKEEDWKFTDLNSILSKNFDNITNKDFLLDSKKLNLINELIAAQNNISLPVCFLNIGGISNITIVKERENLSKLISKDSPSPSAKSAKPPRSAKDNNLMRSSNVLYFRSKTIFIIFSVF